MKNKQAEKKQYEEPRISIIWLQTEDVITTSGEEDNPGIVTPPLPVKAVQ